MSEQIINVKRCHLDEECLEITLRRMPSFLGKLIGQKPKIVTYRGSGDHWYRCPDYNTAPASIAKLLKAICHAPEFRHIQLALQKRLPKAIH